MKEEPVAPAAPVTGSRWAPKPRVGHGREHATSLDLLEDEDRKILGIVNQFEDQSGTQVVDRANNGNRAKLLVRHMAVREAALMDVVCGLRQAGLSPLADTFTGDLARRRRHMDAVEKMSRSVQGIYLNTGQDFDPELSDLLDTVRPELVWDLHHGIPAARRELEPGRRSELFHPARHVTRHAPTNLSPAGPTWWERAPVVSRLVTIYHHLRDYPRATRDART
jgi:hypothetical protein